MQPAAIANQLSVLAATATHEKSRIAFYVFGILAAVWAVVVSVWGLRTPEFPADRRQARLVMGFSAAIVVATITAAVVTASRPASVAAYTVAEPAKGTAPAPTPLGAAPAAAAPATARVAIAADPAGGLFFDKKTVRVKAGTVAFDFANKSSTLHNLTINQGTSVVGATPSFSGSSSTVTVTLKPGAYTYVCTLHPVMTGTLTVN